MSKSINEVSLIDLLPDNLKTDKDILAASKSIDKEFIEMAAKINSCIIFADIDNTASEIVDMLACELNLGYYDSSLPLNTRKELVKNGLLTHKISGTKSAIEELINIVFGDGTVEEWFEYDGQPYNFRVKTSNPEANTIKAQEFIKLITAYKNVRSHLESIIITTSGDLNLYFDNIVHECNNLYLEQVV